MAYNLEFDNDATFEVELNIYDDRVSGVHNDLTGRDADNAHPISAVTNLQDTLDAKEATENKVTIVSATSTDTEYPSAKAVYDAIQGVTPGEGKWYWCTYGVTTYADIVAQINAGRIPVVTYSETSEEEDADTLSNTPFIYSQYTARSITFTATTGMDTINTITVSSGNVWAYNMPENSLEQTGRIQENHFHGVGTLLSGAICAYDAKGLVTPMSTGTTGSLQASTTPFRPEKLFISTYSISAGEDFVLLYDASTAANVLATVNESKARGDRYWDLYLVGTYDRNTGLFTLDTTGTAGETCYYKYVPNNNTSLVLSDYFTAGKYYIKLGSFSVRNSAGTTDLFNFTVDNPMYYFDGTNLINPHGSGSGSDSHFYWCTYQSTTFAAITQALEAGKLPVVSKEGCRYDLLEQSDDEYTFLYINGGVYGLRVSSIDEWTDLGYITSLEMESNKTTEVTAGSTDSEYPSAKAVYDAIQGITPGESRWYFVTYGSTTYVQIQNAIASGKIPVCVEDKFFTYSGQNDDGKYTLTSTMGETAVLATMSIGSDDEWQLTQITVQDEAMRVSDIESYKTDEKHYPNAKAVADYVTQHSSDKFYWCVYGTTTYTEVDNALMDGKVPVLMDGQLFIYSGLYDNKHVWTSVEMDSSSNYTLDENNEWGGMRYQYENTQNKTDNVESYGTSSDYYASTKGVYDIVTEKVGNETTRATGAETTLQTNIDNEVSRASVAENSLLASINNVSSNLATEITRATEAEALKENLSNKVTTVTSTSTDTEYPSAKAVYDTIHGLEGVEFQSNKVTEMSASSTDTEYPSAKCVYDAIQGGGGGSSSWTLFKTVTLAAGATTTSLDIHTLTSNAKELCLVCTGKTVGSSSSSQGHYLAYPLTSPFYPVFTVSCQTSNATSTAVSSCYVYLKLTPGTTSTFQPISTSYDEKINMGTNYNWKYRTTVQGTNSWGTSRVLYLLPIANEDDTTNTNEDTTYYYWNTLEVKVYYRT